MLELASYVAATKCRKLGPRPGLPTKEEVPASLLKGGRTGAAQGKPPVQA